MIERALPEQVGTDAIAELVSLLEEVEADGRDPRLYLLGLVTNTRNLRALYLSQNPDSPGLIRIQLLADSIRAVFYPQLMNLAEALLEREDGELLI